MDHHPQLLIDLWVHDYGALLCERVFENYPQCVVHGLSNREEYADNRIARSPYAHKVSNLSCHLVDHGFYTIVHTSVEDKDKNYIQMEPVDVSEFNLPEKYVVVTTGYTTSVREWNSDSVNETVEYIISKGYVPVFLGKTATATGSRHVIVGHFSDGIDYSKGIDLRDKTDLFKAHGVMAGAKCVIGLDNGLCHLAGMTEVPLVIAFTTVLARHRMPYRHDKLGWNCYPIEIPELACFGCQSRMNFADTTHRFDTCFYKDFKCVEMMTSDRFIKELEKIL